MKKYLIQLQMNNQLRLFLEMIRSCFALYIDFYK